MNKLKKLAVLSLLFSGKTLFSAEETAINVKRDHEQVTPEDRSEEPSLKKSRIKKSVVWKEELVEEFTIPGIRSEFFIDGEQIDLPICLERKVFNGEPFTETEIALLSDYSSDEETEIETEEETEAE